MVVANQRSYPVNETPVHRDCRTRWRASFPGSGHPLTTWLEALREKGFNFSLNSEGVEIEEDGTVRRSLMGTISRVCEASADFCLQQETRSAQTDEIATPISSSLPNPTTLTAVLGHARMSFVKPVLDKKGWSIHDWALEAKVDNHTANDYLKGITTPYPSTRKKLAASLGVEVNDLPK